jgi:hypothetical protein
MSKYDDLDELTFYPLFLFEKVLLAFDIFRKKKKL